MSPEEILDLQPDQVSDSTSAVAEIISEVPRPDQTVADEKLPAPIFDTGQVIPHKHTWLDGNYQETAELNLKHLSSDLTWSILESLIARTEHLDRYGEVESEEESNAMPALLAAFEMNVIVRNSTQPIPDSEKASVILSTLMNVEPERPIFKRGDKDAPADGETVIYLRAWSGGTKRDERPLKLYFRTPKAGDAKAWNEHLGIAFEEKDSKGRVRVRTRRVSPKRVEEFLFGNKAGREPMFLRAEGYSDRPPILHLYFAAQHLMTGELGK